MNVQHFYSSIIHIKQVTSPLTKYNFYTISLIKFDF